MDRIRVPERTASPEELAEDRRRYLAAKPSPVSGQPQTAARQSGAARKAKPVRALKRHEVPSTPAEAAEERRLYPRYVEIGGKPPVNTTQRQYVVEINRGITFTFKRDKAPGMAEAFVKHGIARRARVLLVTTLTTTEVLRDFRALRGPKVPTHGKNGRPQRQAVTS